MEEKKVCPECENTEQKLEELTQEEAQQVAGGKGKGVPNRYVKCRYCNEFTYDGNFCNKCGKPL